MHDVQALRLKALLDTQINLTSHQTKPLQIMSVIPISDIKIVYDNLDATHWYNVEIHDQINQMIKHLT